MNFDEVWKGGEHIKDSIFKEEGEVLYNAVMELPENSIIVEIGCHIGRSTHVLATTAKLRNSKVIAIDPFLKSFDGWSDAKAKECFVRDVLDVFDNVQLIEGYSQNVVEQVPEMGLLFIDGDHSYDGAKKDCENYLPKLKSGGTVILHDYVGTSFMGLQRAVDEFCRDWDILSLTWSVIAMRKPRECTVYTGGSYDIAHMGHVNFFRRIKELFPESFLVVSLNTDAFIESYKGAKPTFNYSERKTQLLCCKDVDLVVPNIGGEDSKPAIRASRANIIAIGQDWLGRNYCSQMQFTPQWLTDNNITLVYIPHTDNISSTIIKERIKNA